MAYAPGVPLGSELSACFSEYFKRRLSTSLDVEAGGHFILVQLTTLGLQCTELDQERRPDLETVILPVLLRLNERGKAAERQERRGSGRTPQDSGFWDIMESQMICPISHVSAGKGSQSAAVGAQFFHTFFS